MNLLETNNLENVKTENQTYKIERATRKIKLLTQELDGLRNLLLSKDENLEELETRIQNLEDILKETEKPEQPPKPEAKLDKKEKW